MKKILLPTDFSKNAWNAISYALEFFKNEQCTFYVLHTYTPTIYRLDYMIWGPTYSAIPDSKAENALIQLEDTVARIKKQFKNPKHSFEAISAFNILTDEISDVCKRKEIDLIVMGTQGATGAKKVFLGTNTVHVIRKSKVPVLVVPTGYAFQAIKSILFPSDFKTSCEAYELQFLINIVKMFNADFNILHVLEKDVLTEEQRNTKKVLLGHFNDLKPSFEEVSGQQVPDAINDFIKHNDIGLLVMMNRSHSFLNRLMVKPNVDAMGNHPKVPFLALPIAQDEQPKNKS